MNKTIVGGIGFLLGAAVGVLASWRILDNKYSQIAQEEIDSVKEVFKVKDAAEDIQREMTEEELDKLEEELDETPEEETVKTEYHKMAGVYTNDKPSIEEYISKKANADEKPSDRPYVIRPEEFGEDHDYEQISLTLYSDGIVADDDDSIMENVDEVIGSDSLDHFGEYEDDSVYVRNEKLMCEYEILLDNRKYSEVLEEKPYLRKGVL